MALPVLPEGLPAAPAAVVRGAERVLRVGVVGCGYWGPKIIRNFQTLEGSEVRAACDVAPERVDAVRELYPTVRSAHFDDLLRDPEIDAVAVCTPVRSHFPLARAALEAGKHVMVEKPLTDSAATARVLVELAEARGLALMVDHTCVYDGAVRKLREIIDSGDVGDLLYLDFVRVNPGRFQEDVNVLWDLGPHDLSVLGHLVDRRRRWVSAVGSARQGGLEDRARVTVQFDGGLIAHLHLDWFAPVKVRSTRIVGSRRTVVYDGLASGARVRVYERGVGLPGAASRPGPAPVDHHGGEGLAPRIDATEPLARVCQSFVDAVEGGLRPATDGRSGLEVVRILEAAQQSLRRAGQRVSLEAPR